MQAQPERSRLAAFSAVVSECALQGDGIARSILSDAGARLSAYAVALLERLGNTVNELGIYGSVLLKCPMVRETFLHHLKAYRKSLKVALPSASPELGAALYGIDHCQD